MIFRLLAYGFTLSYQNVWRLNGALEGLIPMLVVSYIR